MVLPCSYANLGIMKKNTRELVEIIISISLLLILQVLS